MKSFYFQERKKLFMQFQIKSSYVKYKKSYTRFNSITSRQNGHLLLGWRSIWRNYAYICSLFDNIWDHHPYVYNKVSTFFIISTPFKLIITGLEHLVLMIIFLWSASVLEFEFQVFSTPVPFYTYIIKRFATEDIFKST